MAAFSEGSSIFTRTNIGLPQCTTARRLVEPEPSRTVTEPVGETFTGEEPKQPAPSSWQCPGCGTIYSMFVNSCACQTHRWITSGSTIKLYPRRDTE